MLVRHEKILYQKPLTLGYYQPTMKQETSQTPSKYTHTQSKQRRNPRNMGLSSESQQKGHGHEFLAKSQQRNLDCEFLAKAHNGGYTQSNLQRNHDREFFRKNLQKSYSHNHMQQKIHRKQLCLHWNEAKPCLGSNFFPNSLAMKNFYNMETCRSMASIFFLKKNA